MATFDDFQAVLNNPYTNPEGLSLAEALSRINTPPPPTLPESKAAEVSARLAEKQQKLGYIQPNGGAELWAQGGSPSGSLLDVAQSSLAQAGGNLADAARGASNAMFGTNFEDVSADIGWSNRDVANELTGVSEAYQAELDAEQQYVGDAVEEGRWGDAALGTINAIPGVIAQSTGSLAELGLGAIGTGGIGLIAGLGAKALRGKKMLDAANKGKKIAKDVAPDENWMNTLQTAVKATPKALAQTSLVTADMVQQTVNDYREANGGADPSGADLAKMIAMNAATMAASPWMVKNLYLPRPMRNFGKPSAKMKEKAALKNREIPNKTLRDKFENEVGKMVEKMDEGALKSIGLTILNKGEAVLKAGGAEAVQEYAQTWAQILGAHASVDDPEGFWSAAIREAKKTDNINESITAAFLGAGAGGGTKGLIDAPAATLATGVHITKGVTKTGAKFLGKRAQRAADSLISDEKRAQFQDEYKTKLATHEALKEKNATLNTEVEKAATFKDITDPDLRSLYREKAGAETDLNDNDEFARVSNNVQATLKGQVGASATTLEATNAYKYGKEALNTVVTTVAEEINISKEDVDKAINTAKELGNTAKEELKGLNKSAARGITQIALTAAADQTRGGFKAMREGLRNHTPGGIETVAGIISGDMPKVAKEMRRMATEMRQATKLKGLREDRLVSENDFSDSVKMASNPSTFNESDVTLAENLQQDAKGRWENRETVEIFEKALDAHVKSNNRVKIPDRDVARLRKKIAQYKKRFDAGAINKAEKVVKKAAKNVGKAITKGRKLVDLNTAKAIRSLDQWADDFLKGKPKQPEAPTKKGKKAWVVQTNKQMADYLGNLRGALEGALDSGDAAKLKEFQDKIRENITSEEFVQTVATAYGTTNVDTIFARLKDALPTMKLDPAEEADAKAKIKAAVDKMDALNSEVEVELEGDQEVDLAEGEIDTGAQVDPDNPDVLYVKEDLTPSQLKAAEKILEKLSKKVCN